MKSVLWRVAKRLSYIEDARCLKVNPVRFFPSYFNIHFNIILPSDVFGLPSGFLTSDSPTRNLLRTCHKPT